MKRITIFAILLGVLLVTSCKSSHDLSRLNKCKNFLPFLKENIHISGHTSFYMNKKLDVSVKEFYELLSKRECWLGLKKSDLNYFISQMSRKVARISIKDSKDKTPNANYMEIRISKTEPDVITEVYFGEDLVQATSEPTGYQRIHVIELR